MEIRHGTARGRKLFALWKPSTSRRGAIRWQLVSHSGNQARPSTRAATFSHYGNNARHGTRAATYHLGNQSTALHAGGKHFCMVETRHDRARHTGGNFSYSGNQHGTARGGTRAATFSHSGNQALHGVARHGTARGRHIYRQLVRILAARTKLSLRGMRAFTDKLFRELGDLIRCLKKARMLFNASSSSTPPPSSSASSSWS